MSKGNILILFFLFCQFSGECSGRQLFTNYFKFKFDGKSQLYCADYFLETKEYRTVVEIQNFESASSSIILPQAVVEWFSNFISLLERKSFKSDTIDFSKKDLEHYIWAVDFNADGAEDIGLYDWEVSGGNRNAIYRIYLNLPGAFVRWYGAPNPIGNIEVESRKITCVGGGGLYASSSFIILNDTTLHAVHFWQTYWGDSTRRLFRKDSILINGFWEVKIDSNFTFDN